MLPSSTKAKVCLKFSLSAAGSISILLFITANSLVANPPDTLAYFPDHRVQGGAATFYQFLSNSLHYPYPARQDGTVGTAIISLTLHPTGNITLATINPISPSIDAELLTKFRDTEQLWLADSLEKKSFVMFFSGNLSDWRFPLCS
ncbi:hypothetical protein [Tunicatimonas pelagia]|uniref:hypothetical protein n=1 Tax=Tunicatimonas pelagia TaxID=931531 RepID=UPI0026658068|nr:hypothetical protein [Tunicatimonas pelagia]WKN42493.1 hypothetical protein P0M28_26000 [Tunicatimonas pelagia]